MTIGQLISRIRTINKLQNSDARISDRTIYNQMVTARDYLLKNERDKNNTSKLTYLYKPLNYVELIDVDTVGACNIESGCTMKRSKERLPDIIDGKTGDIIKAVTSIDGIVELQPTTQKSILRKAASKNRQYDPNNYYYLEDQYIYTTMVEWDAVKIVAIFANPTLIDQMNDCSNSDFNCVPIKDTEFLCPGYLNTKVIEMASLELMNQYNRLKEDTTINKNPNQ